jgi:predicted secreted protein with PEFG-CTERM motif
MNEMDYKAYTLMAILLASLALVVPIGPIYATTNTTGAASNNEANVPAINATGGQWKTFDLTVGGQTRPIQYMITGGSVENMSVYSENQTLGVTINSDDNGTLSLRLPRNVIDSKTVEGSDADFAAFIDNAEYADPGEIEPGAADTRTLLIGFPAGAGSIDVIGTTTNAAAATTGGNATTAATTGGNATTAATTGGNATTAATTGGNATIPEFSTVAVVVLAVAIIGIIIATSRHSRFSLGQRT